MFKLETAESTRAEVKLYKVFVTKQGTRKIEKEDLQATLKYGFVADKGLTPAELLELNKTISWYSLESKELVKTLFSRNELRDLSTFEKVVRQIVHYISDGTYGKKEVNIGNDSTISFNVIKIVTEDELQKLIEEDIYTDKPLSTEKVQGIISLIKEYDMTIDYSKIKNREVLAAYIAETAVSSPYRTLQGVSGDDVVRAMIYLANDKENALLIKSRDVIETVHQALCIQEFVNACKTLLTNYDKKLAQVFNRHKTILLALKGERTHLNTLVNKISKMSKKLHIPVKLPKYQTFLGDLKVLTHDENSMREDIRSFTITERFKILNALSIKKMGLPSRTFMIRNGNVWTKDGKEEYINSYRLAEYLILESLHEDLAHLRGKKVKLPKYIKYTLPISEKMSCGNIPFGSVIYRQDTDKMLTVGMYWRNEWGSRDLDLSSIDLMGNRIGWGNISSYEKGVIFSGDITNAEDGAIECIGNPTDTPAILINNIFNGECGTRFKVVVGEFNKEEVYDSGEDIFLEDVMYDFDYKFQGDKRSCVLGALMRDRFILYPAQLGCFRVSGDRDNNMLRYITAPRMTVDYILEKVIGAEVVWDGECDYDLSLEKVTFKDIQELFTKTLDK